MSLKLSVSFVFLLVSLAAAQAGDPLCCKNVVPASSSQAQEFLDLTGIFLTDYNIEIGLECYPSNAGVCGGGTTLVGCTQPATQPIYGVACIET
ncbi:hypothetical protein B0H16DRAFT_1718631 [Mycena metata]|uniref:Hydrophobin n=1 Tax=Mycena metata TaxID=1033252 RepID=A0AAD7JIS7_9AGAR|nr:hypothetical protein B0H16DRAFT_1718631 [Mycena metata]